MGAYTELFMKELKMTKGMENGRRGLEGTIDNGKG